MFNRTPLHEIPDSPTSVGRVRDLIKRNLLKATEHGNTDGRPFHRIDRAALDTFLNRLFGRLMLAGNNHFLVPLNDACRRKSLNQSDFIEMIMNGKLRRVARIDLSSKIRSLVVDLGEIPDHVAILANLKDGSDPKNYLNLTEVERALSTTTVTVTALLKHGLLPTEMRTNPRTLQKQSYVHRKTITAFLENHRSLHCIARGWRRNIVLMKSELDQNGLEPIFETSGKIARYYRKEDLVNACLLPPNA